MAGADAVICYGNAKPDDTHLLADVIAIDADVIAWLERKIKRQEEIPMTMVPTTPSAAAGVSKGAARRKRKY